MNEARWEQWGAASGLVSAGFGAAGAAFERGAPPASAPGGEVAAFFADNRGALLAQSLMFAFSAGAFLWFLGSLRSFLARAEGGTARLSTVAFGAGAVGIGISVLIQAPQVALATAAQEPVEPGLARVTAGLGYALNTISYVPFAVMLAAVAVVALRTLALPVWLGWLSAAAGAAYLVLSFGLVADGGPLVPGGALTYVVLPLYAVWLVAASIVMIVRLGRL